MFERSDLSLFFLGDSVANYLIQSNAIDIAFNASAPDVNWFVTSAKLVEGVTETDLPTADFSLSVDPVGRREATLTVSPSIGAMLTTVSSTTYIQLVIQVSFLGTFNLNLHVRTFPTSTFVHVFPGTGAALSLSGPPSTGTYDFSWELSFGAATPGVTGFNFVDTGATSMQSVRFAPTEDGAALPNLDLGYDSGDATLIIHDGVGSSNAWENCRGEFPAGVHVRSTRTAATDPTWSGCTLWRSTGPVASGNMLSGSLPAGLGAAVGSFTGGAASGLTLGALWSVSNLVGTPAAGGWSVDGGFSITVSGTVGGSSFTGAAAGCTVSRELHLRELNSSSGPYELAVTFTDIADTLSATASTGTNYSFTSVSPAGGESTFSLGGTSGSGFDLDFAANELEPGSSGSVTVTVSDGDSNHPPFSFTIQLNVSTPSLGELFVSPASTGAVATLQTGRERTRWRDHVYLIDNTDTVVSTVDPSYELSWVLFTPSGIKFTSATKLGTDPDPTENYLSTLTDGTSGQFLPTGSASLTVRVRAMIKAADGTILQGGNTHDLTLPVIPTAANMNVAILLDRSGSMNSGGRWSGAITGAHWIAQQIQALNDGGDNHKVAILWFGGWDNAGSNYPTPSSPIDPFGEGHYGILSDGLTSLDFVNFPSDLSSTTFVDALATAETAMPPKHWTAIGAGMLYARDKLRAEDLPSAAERILLCLSDGEENRQPLIGGTTTIFNDASPPTWEQDSDGVPGSGGDPNVRIYAAALGTLPNWVNVLRNAADETGGIGELDVKDLADPTLASTIVPAWFQANFARLFDYTPISVPPDPTLAEGDSEAFTGEVTHGHSQLIFNLFMAQTPAADDSWEISIEPPGGSSILDEEIMASTSGIRILNGPRYRSIIIDLPLALSGQGHRWAGTWTMHVRRNEAGAGDFETSILARTDLESRVILDGGVPPLTDRPITIRAVALVDGVPVTNARAHAQVQAPGPWLGELYSEMVLEELHEGLPNDPSPDHDDPRQFVARAIRDQLELEDPPHARRVPLHHVGDGIYEGSFTPDVAGNWHVDTTIEGHRAGKLSKAGKDAQKEALEGLHGQELAEARAYLREIAGTLQGFVIEDRQSIEVRFAPAPNRSKGRGYFLGRRKIRLSVQPRDERGELLGPGWAHAIEFRGPRSKMRWAAKDSGNGTYYVDVEVGGKSHFFYDKRLWAHELVLTHLGVRYPSWGGSLDLDGFSASVLGFHIPIKVRGRAIGLDLSRLHELLRRRRTFDPFEHARKLAELAPPSKADIERLERLRKVTKDALGRDFTLNARTLPVWRKAVSLTKQAVERTLDDLECGRTQPVLIEFAQSLDELDWRLRQSEGHCLDDSRTAIDEVRAQAKALIDGRSQSEKG